MAELRIRLLAVGQGDCLILEFPDRSLAVIDCGGMSTAANVALAFLNPLLQEGRRLRFVLATHPDKDHVEGIPALLVGLARKPDVFYHCGVRRRFREGTKVGNLRCVEIAREVLGEERVISRQAGDSIDLDVGQPTILVLNPAPSCVIQGEVRSHHERNNVSVVLQLDFRGTVILLCGDIEQAGWTNVVERPEFRVPNVIKAPHHGARNALPPPGVLNHLGNGAWILLSTDSAVPDKPHPDVLQAFWDTPARTRCTGWAPHCAASEQQPCPATRGAVSWPESLRQAYLLRPPQQILQADAGTGVVCCGDHELVLDAAGTAEHSVDCKWCDEGPTSRLRKRAVVT
jgi:hypothetical protein